MTWIDYAVLAILLFSVLLSVIRGFVRELIAIAGWIAAFIVAGLYSGTLSPYLPEAIPAEPLRAMGAFLILFVSTLIAASLVALAVSRLVKSAGLSVEDRMLGALFGLLRGALVVMVLVLIAGLTALPRQPAWTQAWVTGPLETLALQIKVLLPDDWSRHIRYH